ncbi:MAG: hypothetical protein LBL99_02480, partial [Holosporaceae bacterium]|nr:hypothetical protein [Holosporaceae bacterium]
MTAVNKNPPLNKPENILSSWIALEVLQPAVFRRPEELAFNQDRNLIVKLPDKVADWNDVSLKPKKYYNVYYHLILGTLDFKQSMEALSRAYSDKRAERPAAFGDAIIASIVLDDRGRFVWSGQDPVAISSFAWGLNFALQGDLLKLGDWEGASQKVAGKIAEFFDDKRNKNGEPLAIVRSDVDEAYNLLINELKIPPHLGKK